MTKKDVMDYVTETPHNVNRNILGQKLDALQKNVSWNDLKDKPFYTEMVEEIVLLRAELANLSSKYEGDVGYIATPFVLDRHYIVIFDGVEYECVGTTVYHGYVHRVCIGNPQRFDSTNVDNGMPFAILSGEDSDFDWCTFYDAEAYEEAHTVEIRQKVETVHKLDAKYLPHDFVVECTVRESENNSEEDVRLVYGDFATAKVKIMKGIPVGYVVRWTETSELDTNYLRMGSAYDTNAEYEVDSEGERIWLSNYMILPDNTIVVGY